MKTVIYLDDNEDDLEFFRIAAQECTVNVHLIRETPLLFNLLEKEPLPDIIFVDYSLGTSTAPDIIAKLRSKKMYRRIPIVVLSNYDDKGSIYACRKAGANYYINKPRSIKTYIKVIALTLDIDWDSFLPSEKDFSF